MFVAVPLTLLASSAAVYQASSAAFNASTNTGANAWAAGIVAISNSSSGAALFNASGLTPGAGGEKCITVTYTGDLAASVKLYVTNTSGSLGQYLDLTVEEGSGGDAACLGFVSATTLSDVGDTLAHFSATHTQFSDGVSTWAPTAAGQTKVDRIAWTLKDDNGAQGLTAGAKLVWEARNT